MSAIPAIAIIRTATSENAGLRFEAELFAMNFTFVGNSHFIWNTAFDTS
jgi:hypothetical protein